ncbi:MAG: hypothetical protein H0X24_24685 [Ktedonobacterales bacterium]|nr:hypothetical protein [Ktedonobacterales bacterium]
MADDAQPTPPDKQLVQWLRALADVVESDPALATRVTQGLATPPPLDAEAPLPLPAAAAASASPFTAADEPSAEPAAVTAPPPTPAAETITPTLRHTRKTSRFGPSVTGRPMELGTGVPNPFTVFSKGGEEGLRRALEALRVGTLRAIIRAHDLDPANKLNAAATEKRLVTAIIAAVKRSQTEPAAKTPRRRPMPPPL